MDCWPNQKLESRILWQMHLPQTLSNQTRSRASTNTGGTKSIRFRYC